MWIRNAWYVAAWSHEIAGDGLLARTIMNEPLVLYRTSNGSVVAMEDRCCHRLAPLSLGRREGDDLRCMYHGLKFGPDGRCNEIPGQTTIPTGRWSAAIRWSRAAVGSGSGWARRRAPTCRKFPRRSPRPIRNGNIQMGCLDYAAQLPTHQRQPAGSVASAFRASRTPWAKASPQWATRAPDDQPAARAACGSSAGSELAAPAHYFGKPGEAFDTWNSYDFLVPGLFIQRPAWYPPGTADMRLNLAAADRAGRCSCGCDDQAVMPVTGATSRYFYSAGGRSKSAMPALRWWRNVPLHRNGVPRGQGHHRGAAEGDCP